MFVSDTVFRPLLVCCRLLLVTMLFSPVAVNAASSLTDAQFRQLDSHYQDFSRSFYRQLVAQPGLPLEHFKNIADLKYQLDALLQADKAVEAIATIHYNRKLIESNIDALETISIVALLLQYNDWHEAKDLFSLAQSFAGKSATSNISFEFAKYFMQRKDWQNTQLYLNDIINDLAAENANYARIMLGTVMQYEKKHREAVAYYKKVPPTSKYYATAVLNTAVAYIRQDWWTDAHILINDTLKNHRNVVSDVMADRLNLTLGYALLRINYFRNSRDTFRNVSLKSPYTNRALLGLALSAANQDDYIGALNAITILKEKKTTDLAVDEAYLLLPYTYGKLKQHLTASSAYTDAIKYYQERIASLTDITSNGGNILSLVRISTDKSVLKIKSNDLDYSIRYPESFFYNYTHLIALDKYARDMGTLSAKYSALTNEFNSALRTVSMELIAERTDYLNSYLNQARYGLARLYDTSLISAN